MKCFFGGIIFATLTLGGMKLYGERKYREGKQVANKTKDTIINIQQKMLNDMSNREQKES